MQLTLTRATLGCRPATAALCAQRRQAPVRALRGFSVRCDSDDEIVPIVSGRQKKGFTKKEYEQLANPKLHGGATIGDELSIIRKKYLTAEAEAIEKFQLPKSKNWDGDVYIGSNWNELSIGMLLVLLIVVGGLVFAWATYGTLWATGEYY